MNEEFMMAEESKNPVRDIPKSLLMSVFTVSVLYICVNYIYVCFLSLRDCQNFQPGIRPDAHLVWSQGQYDHVHYYSLYPRRERSTDHLHWRARKLCDIQGLPQPQQSDTSPSKIQNSQKGNYCKFHSFGHPSAHQRRKNRIYWKPDLLHRGVFLVFYRAGDHQSDPGEGEICRRRKSLLRYPSTRSFPSCSYALL